MSTIIVRVHGQADFAKNQAEYLQKVTTTANIGLDEIAKITKEEDQSNCPVDTGLLRTNHVIAQDVEGKYRFIRYLFNDCEYALFVHEGTFKMAARPWFLNGTLATQSQFVPLMSRI